MDPGENRTHVNRITAYCATTILQRRYVGFHCIVDFLVHNIEFLQICRSSATSRTVVVVVVVMMGKNGLCVIKLCIQNIFTIITKLLLVDSMTTVLVWQQCQVN